jgi:hypothetical protein
VASAVVCALLALAGCPDAPTPTAPTATVPTANPPPPGTATIAVPPADDGRWHGTWLSDGCGERAYQRIVTLAAGGEARGEERVSPCPPGVACVWSGIVPWSGRWSAAGDRVRLELEPKAAPGAAIALPSELVWDQAAAAPAEESGAERCVYRRPPAD